MRDETGIAPWHDEGPWHAPRRRVLNHTVWENTPNVTEVPVPGDPTPCGTNSELWHAPPGSVDAQNAAYGCSACWMKADCAEYGIANPDEEGVWGGLSMRERRARNDSIAARSRGKRVARSKRWA